MNNSDNDIQPEEVPAEVQQPEAVPVVEAPPPIDNRRRLRELLSIPERDRSDEQWDEIIELEIQMAPGNRISGAGEPMGNPSRQQPRQQRQGRSGGGHQGGGHFNASADNNASGQQQKKHRPRTKTNRRPRQGGKPDGGGTPA